MKKKATPLKRKKRSNKETLDHYMTGRMGSHLLECSQCQNLTEASSSSSAVICPDCVQKSVAPPAAAKEKKPKGTGKRGRPRKNPPKVLSGKPRGWHFKAKYVHTDGTVWSYGKPVESKATKKIKKEIKDIKEL